MQKSPSQTPSPAAPPAPPVPGPTAPVVVGVPDFAALTAQLTALQVQRSALRAELNGLNRQLNSMRIDNPARPPVQQRAADVGVRMAQTEGEIARIEAQMAARQGVPGYGVPTMPPRVPNRQFDPDVAAGLMFAVIFAVLMPLSIAVARRIWKGRPVVAPAPDATIAPRFDRLEQAVDAIAIEIERVSEGQRFVTKILAERPAANSAPPSAANLNEVRALGAGPAEAIPLAERQKVGQRNTPH